MELKKPRHLSAGDTIATVSISHGWAGEQNMLWKYELGKKRLETIFNLKVIPAPNSMKGFAYLKNNPQARADDIMWAFENKDINAIIANVGGNDSIKVIPFIDSAVIKNNPKIFIGYSDVMNIHFLCYKAGLSTFYGHNFLPTIAEAQGFHSYSERWFKKTLFDISPIGRIEPSENWTYENQNYDEKNFKRNYYPNPGYELIQGEGIARGRLIGGHTGISGFEKESITLTGDDFKDSILFIEDIPEFFTPDSITNFFKWLGYNGFLQKINGIIIGRICENNSFDKHSIEIKNVINGEFGLKNLPVLYGLNFGHSSPMFIIPYGAKAEINSENKSFVILESGVV